MNVPVDMILHEVTVTFRNGEVRTGRCTGNPIACSATNHHGIFDYPFMFMDTTDKSGRHLRAMIRIEDIQMIEVRKVGE